MQVTQQECSANGTWGIIIRSGLKIAAIQRYFDTVVVASARLPITGTTLISTVVIGTTVNLKRSTVIALTFSLITPSNLSKTQKAAKKPFLAYISTNAPHGPLHCPEEFSKPYIGKHGKNVGNFFGMIANIDDNVSKLRAFLDDEGLTDNTIFIFTTDNGTATGAGVFNSEMRGRKGSEYDGGHRVPFFVHWPNGNLKTAVDVEPITHAVDVLPTLMDLCHVTSSKERNFDGKSIASLLRGKPDTNTDWDNRILVTDSQRVKDPIMWKSSSVMTSKWRLVNGKELYDIHSDPGQKNNVAKAYPGEVRRLRDFYQGWWEEIEPSFKNATSIYLGHPKSNPARLTSHDWITTGSTPWNQGHIRKGVDNEKSTGFWYVNVHSAGTYEIELRRWPEESNRAINAGMKPGAPVPGARAFRETPGREFSTLDTAHVEIFGEKHSSSFDQNDVKAKFRIELPAGKTKLTASFTGTEDQSVGAYYAYVTRVEN